jgi:tetratricopeptide (TPR) repeat protein
MLTALCSGVVVAQPVNTNAPIAWPELAKRAAVAEQAGRKQEAADIYEQILRVDPTREKVLARRLVQLYAEAGNAEKALRWADVILKDHPDPGAFLAGVHSLLGRYDEAKRLLRVEMGKAGSDKRRQVLYWQLADVCEKEGKLDEAEQALRTAVDLVAEPSEKATAESRLGKFRQKHGGAKPR